jgi:predicted nucleic acid-binding protein
MGLSSALTDPIALLVADASTIINLVSTGNAAAILGALPNRVVVVDQVPAELETGRALGKAACHGLNTLITAGAIEVVTLPDAALPHFEDLVVGSAVQTVDDGEAATIAYALAFNATPVIDERKATRICTERFPHLRIASTIDVLVHDEVQQTLGVQGLQESVFRALQVGRMGVLPQYLDWVVELIGRERAALCASLPQRVRSVGTLTDRRSAL